MKKRDFVLCGFKAFTLAEVLITLVIIGVIGALTVPALIQNTQKQEYVSALKKAYSTLSQATQMIIAEEGSPKSSCITCNDGWAYSEESVYDMYKKYLNNIQECGKNRNLCFKYLSSYKNLNGSVRDGLSTLYGYALKLADGAQVIFDTESSICKGSWGNIENYCSVFVVDVNGDKGPNKIGIDTFYFALKENGLYPAGCDDDSSTCNRDASGIGCACKVLREGAMNY